MDNGVLYDSTVESELNANGVYASVTKGVSMLPLFKTNRDMIILKRPERELSRLDVVLYKNKAGKYLLHRIVKVMPNEYIIRGDNTFTDEHVPKSEILALLTEFNRKGKKVSTDNRAYRLYSRFWTFIYPVRLLLFKCRSLAARVYRKLFKKKQ